MTKKVLKQVKDSKNKVYKFWLVKISKTKKNPKY